MEYVWFVAALAATAALIGYYVKNGRPHRNRGRKALAKAPQAGENVFFAEPTADQPADPPAADPMAPQIPARVKRRRQIDAILGTGRCLHCPDPATHHLPRLQLVRSPLDFLFRWAGAKSAERYRVETGRSFSAVDNDVCEDHHQIARDLLEGTLAAADDSIARAIKKRREDIYAFNRFGLDEAITAIEQRVISQTAERS